MAEPVTTEEPPTPPAQQVKPAFVRYGRPALLALGAGAIVYVIAGAGPGRVLDALIAAAPWMPGIVALDAFYFLGESLAHRALMGERAAAIPTTTFVRVLLASYALSVLAPLGRAGVEVSRVAAYRRWVGAGHAAAASVGVHVISVLANALLCGSATAASATVLGARHPLTVTLLLVTLGMAGLAGVTLLLARRSAVGRWIGRRVPSLREAGEDLDRALRGSPEALAHAAAWCAASRASQVAQSALLIVAVGGLVSPSTALIGQGIHIIGSTFGEAIPGQAGVIEASYRVFAEGLGFAATPARAVAIALLGRLSQIVVATSSLLLLATLPALRRAAEDTASASLRAPP